VIKPDPSDDIDMVKRWFAEQAPKEIDVLCASIAKDETVLTRWAVRVVEGEAEESYQISKKTGSQVSQSNKYTSQRAHGHRRLQGDDWSEETNLGKI